MLLRSMLCLAGATLASAQSQDRFPAREHRQNGAADHVAVAAGDLNGDGFDDVVSTTAFARLRLWLGQRVGGLASAGSLIVDAPVVALDLGDVDGDDRLDIAFTSGKKVFVVFGTGAAQFTSPLQLGLVGDGAEIAVEDLDGDGLDDVCVLSRSNGKLKCWLADGAGGFAPAVTSAVADAPGDFDLADLDQDGYLDAAIASTGSHSVVVAVGMGDGTFEVSATLPVVPFSPDTIALGDMDGDGVVDLCTTNSQYFDVQYRLGQGGVAFGPAVNCGASGRIELFDWDGDGVDERLGLGNGVQAYPDLSVCFSSSTPFLPVSSKCTSIAPLDANGDGWLDFAFGSATHVDEPTGTGDEFTSVGVLLGDGRGGVLDVVRVRKAPRQGKNTLLETADVDLDGIVDVIGLDPAEDVVRIRRGTGSAGLHPPQTLALPGVSKFLLPDLDGDGDPDLVAMGTMGLFTALNLGGEFAVPVRVAPYSEFTYWTHGDLNGDGMQDLLMVSYQLGTFTRLSRGDGTFTGPAPSPDVAYPGQVNGLVRIADLDGDPFRDLVVAAWQGGIWTYRGTGTGTFESVGFVPPELQWTGFDVGDLDGDGLDDVVVSKSWPSCLCNLNSALSFLSDGVGGLNLYGEFEVGREIQTIRLLDLDGDGALDLLAQLNKRVVALCLGTGSGGFSKSTRYGAWGWIAGAGHADLSGSLDLVTYPAAAEADDIDVQFVLQQ